MLNLRVLSQLNSVSDSDSKHSKPIALKRIDSSNPMIGVPNLIRLANCKKVPAYMSNIHMRFSNDQYN
jgi:hypothetical protein